LTASIGGYIYAQAPSAVYVNLFVDSRASIALDAGNAVTISQQTKYPWDGRVTLAIDPSREGRFALLVRIPGWAAGRPVPGDLYRYTDAGAGRVRLSVNGRDVRVAPAGGYARIERTWKKGDLVELDLPMPVRRAAVDARAQEDRARIALERGPLVYCAEWADNGGHALDVVVPDAARLDSAWRADLLEGTQVITGRVQARARATDGVSLETRAHDLVAIPYHRWSNRGMGEMAVWLARAPEDAWIAPAPPAPIATVQVAGRVEKRWTGYNDQNDDQGALYDGRDPISSADESWRYLRLRPASGTPASIDYAFASPSTLSSAAVYWFDDRRFCLRPTSWRLLYRDGETWRPVATRDPYAVEKDVFNRVRFDPITTTALRLEIEPATSHYNAGDIGPPDAMFIREAIEWRECGLLEWRIG
jgi:hypothetical protein